MKIHWKYYVKKIDNERLVTGKLGIEIIELLEIRH